MYDKRKIREKVVRRGNKKSRKFYFPRKWRTEKRRIRARPQTRRESDIIYYSNDLRGFQPLFVRQVFSQSKSETEEVRERRRNEGKEEFEKAEEMKKRKKKEMKKDGRRPREGRTREDIF